MQDNGEEKLGKSELWGKYDKIIETNEIQHYLEISLHSFVTLTSGNSLLLYRRAK